MIRTAAGYSSGADSQDRLFLLYINSNLLLSTFTGGSTSEDLVRTCTTLRSKLTRFPNAINVHLTQTRLEEARQRKEDYATYYDLTLRYGPLSDKDFDMAVYPGRVYVGIISDAAHVVQNWWWSTWPPVLRRRKSAALAVQSAFRGFVKRRQYQGIVRLRTLWGTTRIVAHVFVSWRDQTAKVRRVAAFTNRFRKLCVVRCLQAWRRHVDTEREAREDVVRQRLRRAKDGIRARVFENWVIYTETSLAVDRMRRRVILRPMLRAWSRRALADRVRNRMFWACAKLASRALRYHGRRRFVEAREACCKMQSFARRVVGRAKVQREMAKDIIQAVEVKRFFIPFVFSSFHHL